MERTAEEWGRVAVALPGWRWMPGMRGLGFTHVRLGWNTPDPDDPATAGCLLELHNQGGGWHWVEVDTQAMSYRLCSWMGQGQPVTRGPLATTPGRACIAGAEVDGCWPGGGQ